MWYCFIRRQPHKIHILRNFPEDCSLEVFSNVSNLTKSFFPSSDPLQICSISAKDRLTSVKVHMRMKSWLRSVAMRAMISLSGMMDAIRRMILAMIWMDEMVWKELSSGSLKVDCSSSLSYIRFLAMMASSSSSRMSTRWMSSNSLIRQAALYLLS